MTSSPPLLSQVNDYSCACAPGYTGKQCEEKLPPPCDSKPCGDNMFCVELPPDEHRCEPCAPGMIIIRKECIRTLAHDLY